MPNHFEGILIFIVIIMINFPVPLRYFKITLEHNRNSIILLKYMNTKKFLQDTLKNGCDS